MAGIFGFGDPALEEFMTPQMQRMALGQGLMQAAQAVGSAPGGRRFGSYLGAGVGGFGEGWKSSINNQLGQQAVLSDLLDTKRKRKKEDEDEADLNKRKQWFKDIRSRKRKSELPDDVQMALDGVYDRFGFNGAEEFLLEYYKKKIGHTFDEGDPQDDWYTLNDDEISAIEQERGVFLDRDEQWQLNRKDQQLKSVGKVAGAEADLTAGDAQRVSMAQGYLNDYAGIPQLKGEPTLKELLAGKDELDEDGNIIRDRPGIADLGPDTVQRMTNTAEWNKFKRRMKDGVKALIHQLTGAGMNQGEAEDNAKQYLPLDGENGQWDSGTTVADKAARLAVALRGGVTMTRSGGHPEEYVKRLRRRKDKDLLRILDPDFEEDRKSRYGG